MDFIVGDLVRARYTFAGNGEPISVIPQDTLIAIGIGMITSPLMKRACFYEEDAPEEYKYQVTFPDGDRQWIPQDCLTPIVPKTEEEEK